MFSKTNVRTVRIQKTFEPLASMSAVTIGRGGELPLSRLLVWHYIHSATMVLISIRSQWLLPTNSISERQQLRSLKNEQLKCEKVTIGVEECYGTKAQRRSSKKINLNKKINTFKMLASNCSRAIKSVNRLMSEECSRTTREAIQFRGCNLDKFFFGCKNSWPRRDSNHGPPDPWPQALPTRLSGPSFFYAAIDFISAISFTSESDLERSIKTREIVREKVPWEVNECLEKSAKKVQQKKIA